MSDKHAAGKGSKYRFVDRKKYTENYEKIFGTKKKKILILKRRKRMMDDITTSQVLGTVFYTMVVLL